MYLTDNKITLHHFCTIHSKIESQDYSLVSSDKLLKKSVMILEDASTAYILTVTINGLTTDETESYREMVVKPQLEKNAYDDSSNIIEDMMNELIKIMRE